MSLIQMNLNLNKSKTQVYIYFMHFLKPFMIIWCLVICTQCLKFAVIQSPKFKTIQTFNTQIDEELLLRSYRPHFIHSYSYPEPISPHIYYGQVIDDKPIFFVKDMINRSEPSNQILWVDHLQEKGTYNIHESKKNQNLQVKKYMLNIQLESMMDRHVPYQLTISKEKAYYQIKCKYENTLKQYVLFFSKEDNILNIDEDSLISHRIIDNAAPVPFQGWNFPHHLIWSGKEGLKLQKQTSVKGIIMEIQYKDISLIKQFRMHLKQIYLINNEVQDKQFLANAIIISKESPSEKKVTCAEDAVDKLRYGLSYEYGTLQITNGSQNVPNSPKALLSFSPSRTRFPWGFLWDDGFQCEVAVRTDQTLTLRVIKSWLDTILENGWIPREQNRGPERQQLCSCPPFMKKDIRDGNPPTLILALDYLRKQGKLNEKIFPQSYWDKIKLWHHWFLTTQQSDGDKFLFRWRDSIANNGSFNSGMDDFPRMKNPEAHVDIQSWMYFFTKFLYQSFSIFQPAQQNPYQEMLKQIKTRINSFIDSKDYIYKDYDKLGNFSDFIGYPSLLPLAFGMIQFHSEAYNATIKLIKERMDSGFGINSITFQSPLSFSNQDAYWRGPVWININYLVVRGLKLYYPQQKQYYQKLRKDLLNTVCGNWQLTGFFYENYIKGKGSFSFPFNGWTSLISIIHSQEY